MQLKKLFAARDMTEGAPWKRIMEFVVPMLLGNLAQQLYNTVDSIVVGKYVGDNALAAVGSTGSLCGLITNLFIGLSVGANVVTAKALGASDDAAASRSVHTSMLLALISA